MSRAILLLVALTPLSALAQPANIVAGLQQDVAALRNEVRLLRSEIEEVREIQEKLARSANASKGATAELNALNARIQAVETAAAEARKEDRALVDSKIAAVTGNVNRALETQTARVNSAIKAPPVARAATPVASPSAPAMPADMPKTGVRYKVAFGDSVTKIARKHNSKNEWILAANRMSSNADLKADSVIFVPQSDSAE